MNKGQHVSWIDPVTERTRHGVLRERNLVVAEAKADANFFPKDFTDVHYYTWDIKEDISGKTFCIKEDKIIVDLKN